MIKGSKAWVNFLESKELPVLAKTLKSILKVTADESTSLSQLSQVVLRDADLTSGVIRLANTPVYNPSRTPITTVSRAVVQIGFENVHSIAVSSALVDKLTKNSNRERLCRCLVKSFVAAVHARYMASDLPAELREEIFVAALLFNVGEAAFWASHHVQTNELDQALDTSESEPTELQRQVLGTTLKAISKGLIKSWKLGALLSESIENPVSHEAHIIKLAAALAALSEQGMCVESHADYFTQISKINGKSLKEIFSELKENERKSILLAERLGIKNAKSFIASNAPVVRRPPSDANKVLHYLGHIMSAITEGEELGLIIDKALECIIEGMNFDHAGFYMWQRSENVYFLTNSRFAPKKPNKLKTRLVVGAQHSLSVIFAGTTKPLVKALKMESDQICDADAQSGGTTNALVGPIFRRNRFSGFLLADSSLGGGFSESDKANFQLLLQQLQFSLDLSGKS